MDAITAWTNAQNPIKDAVGVSSYETWFGSLKAVSREANTLCLQAPDEFFKNWIIEHYSSIIEKSLRTEGGSAITVEFEINADSSLKTVPAKLQALEKNFAPASKPSHLNPRFSFENFVVGPSNRFAFAAAQAVADNPGKAYNPLFIYGPVGLGKTHLMHAITQQAQKNHPGLKVHYTSSEQFTNELINSIRHRSAESFRQKYRTIDVLVIDDIHFIAGKESTQEEFFHTFNALHDSRKQIIICSDRPPQEIANLEARLVSRFAWGLITDIQPPDYETRAAILRKKLELESVHVPDEVITFIATEIKTNIRELEGALIRVVAYALLDEKPITLSVAKQVLKDMVKETTKVISVDMVQKEVAVHFRMTVADLKTKRRQKQVVMPRQIAMYLSRKLTSHSLPELGGAFGGKDHTTILHACRKIDTLLATDAELKKTIEYLTENLLQ